MNRKLIITIKVILFTVILGMALLTVAKIVENKSGYEKNSQFFTEANRNHLDMLFFGTSHVINGINPVQLYQETGFTSYNLGGFGSPIISTYWQIMMALEECQPKLVVVDTYMLENDVRYQDHEEANADFDMQHLAMDAYPLSFTKIKACRDLFESKDVQRQFLFNYITYHDRWKELNSNDWQRITGKSPVNKLMGADILYSLHADPYTYMPNPEYDRLPEETIGTEYLKKIITDCHAKGVGVLVVTLPFNAQEADQRANGTAAEICAEYGVPYLNMLAIPDFMDVNIDLSDSGHLNIIGMHKVTSYLGQWLIDTTIAEQIGMTDHRNDPEYDNWNQAVADYENQVQSMSIRQKDLYSQLMMLSLTNKDYIIKINGAGEVFSDRIMVQLIKNLLPESDIDISAAQNIPYFLIKSGDIMDDYVGLGNTRQWDTTMGSIAYTPIADIYQTLYVNGDEENNVIYDDEHAYADIQILFLGQENDSGFESHQYYTCDHFEYGYSE